MKKVMIVCSALVMVAAAHADFSWSWWTGDEKANDDVKGCALGLSVERQDVTGAALGVCIAKANHVKSGALGAIGYSHVEKLANGAQVAFVNQADHAALQFGLLNWNKGGFLPFFVFFNFDKTMFGVGK